MKKPTERDKFLAKTFLNNIKNKESEYPHKHKWIPRVTIIQRLVSYKGVNLKGSPNEFVLSRFKVCSKCFHIKI